MLTDEEVATRIGSALRESAPHLTYDGPMPRVRDDRVGVIAAGVAATTAAIALAPTVIGRDDAPLQQTAPSPPSTATRGLEPSQQPTRLIKRQVNLGAWTFTYTEADGKPGPLGLLIGGDLTLPAEARPVELNGRANLDFWIVDNPAEGDPQAYVKPVGSPLYGVIGEGWTDEQIIALFEHPVDFQRGDN